MIALDALPHFRARRPGRARYLASHRERHESAADRFLDYLTGKYSALAEFPEMGRRRDDVRNGYRGLPVGDYIIFYVIEDDGIAVVHVTHGARRDLV